MLPAKRQAKIIEYLRRERFASLAGLAEWVSASTSTVRRDVDLLCEQGHLCRTHGGASLRKNEDTTIEPAPEISSEIAREAKQKIGEAASQHIEAGQIVLFDSGSTTMAVARAALSRSIAFSAITNDVAIAAVLARSSVVSVEMPGGYLRPRSSTMLGSACLRSLTRLKVDVAFVGAHAVSPAGASETSIEHAEIKRAMLEAADRTLLVADSGKIPGRSLCVFAKLTEFERVITDDGLAADLSQALTALAVELELVC